MFPRRVALRRVPHHIVSRRISHLAPRMSYLASLISISHLYPSSLILRLPSSIWLSRISDLQSPILHPSSPISHLAHSHLSSSISHLASLISHRSRVSDLPSRISDLPSPILRLSPPLSHLAYSYLSSLISHGLSLIAPFASLISHL